ncbi:nitrate- and nitrite sensing domain-containing protein [Streptomyces sp. NPDC058371]|uniref:sensor histidine kinase n=1 Tax=Streptomyces sp. NPDC058371 TaxID=3346463 RepID=UPI00365323E7
MPGTRDRRTRHRSAPRRSLRFSFLLPYVVPAVFLTGLWGYTAAELVDEQLQLHEDADRAASVARPAQGVMSRLQDERRLTAVWQATRTGPARTALDDARKETDAAVKTLRGNSSARPATSTPRAEKLHEALRALPSRREAIDGRTLGADDTFQYFTNTITDSTDLLTSALRSDDGSLARSGAAATSVIQLTEMLSRQDALLSGALQSHRMSAATRTQFAQYLAIQRQIRAGLDTRDLAGTEATSYAQITDSAQWTSVGSIEDAVAAARDTSVPKQASAWPDAAGTVVGDLQGLGSDALGTLAGTADDRAGELLLELLLGTAATAAALAAGAVLARRGRRSTAGRLNDLQRKTEDLAGAWLPQLLDRIGRGERIDPEALAPHRHHATDEVERLGSAIDHLARVAADTAVRQSLGREGTEKVFAQLIRRTQVLVHRLISLLDDLERKHEDSDLLKDIFKVDHLATRVRRHAENLVILSGSPPSRRMTAPVSVTDVMRSAVAETEQYTRVKVKNLPADRRLALSGRAVADVTHLIAELVENGTSFSPPDTQVFVSATKVAKGLAVHVEDHGLGMPEDHRDRANQLLAHPPKLDMTALGEDPRLGHFVVARLAERHGIRVELRESVYGGTLVVVLLPAALLEEHESPVLEQLKSAAAASGRAAVSGADSSETVAGVLVGAGVGASAGAGLSASNAGADIFGRTQLGDHSGFPEYGGAGLLPAAAGHPAPRSSAHSPATTGWTPAQERPASHTAADPGRPPSDPRAEGPGAGYTGPAADQPGARAGYAGPTTDQPGPRAGYTGTATGSPDPAAGRSRPGSGSSGQGSGTTRPAPVTDRNAHDASGPLTTPRVLPQRTRGASLAQQLRKEAAAAQTSKQQDDRGESGAISPDQSARAMIAIQQGLKRARIADAEESAGTDGQQAQSRGPGAN